MDKENWKRFISGVMTKSIQLPEKIATSWELCRKQNVDPYSVKPKRILTASELREKQKRNKELVEYVKAEIKKLSSTLQLQQPLFVLTDSEGDILWRTGNYQAKNYANQIGFKEGSRWTELDVGTNAIGLALRTKENEFISQFEHYSVSSHQWSCYAAVILDEDKEVIGVLDVSTYENESSRDSATFLQLLTQSVTNRIMKNRLEKKQELLQYAISHVDDRILCDDRYRVVRIPPGLGLEEQLLLGEDVRTIVDHDGLIYSKEDIKFHDRLVGFAIRIYTDGFSRNNFYYPGVKSKNKSYNSFLEQVLCVAKSNIPIHIFGESGSGKELIAQTIHYNSPLRKGPLVSVNCGAISENLLESELFGYAPGAFTGANPKGYKGKLEQANGGTLFLDEVDSMSKKMQAALLRVLEDKWIVPIGGEQQRKVSFRLVTASNRDLKELVRKDEFRLDLFYRIYVCPLMIPALRERPEDLKNLISDFCQKKVWPIDWKDDIFEAAKSYSWEGNIREFNNFMERLYLFYGSKQPTIDQIIETIEIGQIRMQEQTNNKNPRTLSDGEENREANEILNALHRNQFHLSNTAKDLGISRTTLYRKMKKHQLNR